MMMTFSPVTWSGFRLFITRFQLEFFPFLAEKIPKRVLTLPSYLVYKFVAEPINPLENIHKEPVCVGVWPKC